MRRRGWRGCGLGEENDKKGWISHEIRCSVGKSARVYKCEAIKGWDRVQSNKKGICETENDRVRVEKQSKEH